MPFQLLDLILIGIMLISGILALMRGFTREVLSVISWVLSALAAYFAIKQPQFLEFVKPYAKSDQIGQIAVGAIAFLIVLIITSIVSVKFSDAVVDSAVGTVDRTLGFFFGLARGLVLVAVCYLLYGWITGASPKEDWIVTARTLPLIRGTASTIASWMPDMEITLQNTALGGGNAQPADDAAPQTPQVTPGDAQNLENLSNGASQQSN